LVQPDTVIRWHREGFRLFWKWKSRRTHAGRKIIALGTIFLIREMSRANPLWGAPRIHGELLKLGLTVAQRTVAKYMVRRPRRSSSQRWTTFLRNHLGQMVSVDFLTVPTLSFHLLYVFVVLSHQRRKVLHFNVADHCRPVLANVGGCKFCKGKHMRMKSDVSDSDFVLAFSAAARMPNWHHACWKTDFFATHRVDSPGAISPRCRSL
jgi:hypothetical protein